MKKVGLLYREKIVDKITQDWKSSQGCIFVNFSKVSALSFNNLRNSLRKEGSFLFVSKNSLIKRALENMNAQDMSDLVDGSTALVFLNDSDVVKVSKMLFDFSKENENFVLKGAFLNNNKLGQKELEEISKLPSRDILIGQAVMGLASPLTGFVGMLNNIILKFVWVIEEIKNKQSKQ